MRCENFRDLFSEYYDGQTTGEISHKEIAAHLAECEACAAEYAEYSALLDEVRNLPEPELPQGFHESLMGYVRENNSVLKPVFARTPNKRKRHIIARVAPLMAVAASLIFVVVWFAGVFQTEPPHNGYMPIVPMDGIVGIVPAQGELPPIEGRGFPPDSEPETEPSYIEIVCFQQRPRNNLLLFATIGVILVMTLGGVIVITRRTKNL